jgi:hypothetical protein
MPCVIFQLKNNFKLKKNLNFIYLLIFKKIKENGVACLPPQSHLWGWLAEGIWILSILERILILPKDVVACFLFSFFYYFNFFNWKMTRDKGNMKIFRQIKLFFKGFDSLGGRS